MLSIAIFDFILSMMPALYVIGSIVIIGALEGVLEEYFKFMDKRVLEVVAATEDDHSNPQLPSTFWSKQRIVRLIFKLSRMLMILIILSISFISTLKVILAIMDGGVASINWNYVLLMPSFKMYKAFTKVMSDVVNNTDEAANDASKVFSGYNTVFGLYESLKSLQSSTTEREEIKKPTNTEDETQ
ncbi:hypothetical protein [Lysinibacillus sp. K60]|uniref:hypothetical protein n=1 Tax=Lysinibacillus sp. K60 TaxID=2720027 RepID=UPI001C8BA299|nr:hypothetical protein [Lysinibacillus sp. K60]MBX8945869.1 hypothetical protein [Lysinibacillus sp. K60]